MDRVDTSGYWKLFAAIMVTVAGVFNVIDGLRSITSANQIESNFPSGRVQLPVTNNLKVWGWVVLIIGIVMILAAFLIASGNLFGRIVGIAVAGINAIVQLSYLDHNTFWSFTMILVDILVIYALVVHGGRGDALDDWTPKAPQAVPTSSSTTEKLSRLAELRANGTLTDDEFERAKAQILSEGT
jgi:hypothetical protein